MSLALDFFYCFLCRFNGGIQKKFEKGKISPGEGEKSHGEGNKSIELETVVVGVHTDYHYPSVTRARIAFIFNFEKRNSIEVNFRRVGTALIWEVQKRIVRYV